MHTHNYPQQDVPCEGITYRNKAVIFLVVIKNKAFLTHLVS